MIAYAITDPSTLHFPNLDRDLEHFATKADMIVYRDKQITCYFAQAKRFVIRAQKYSFQKILLHREVEMAYELKADGIHLTSNQFDQIVQAKQLGLFVVISTHSKKEIALAQKLGADMVTFSSIFLSPNKGKPKGVKLLISMVEKFRIPIIALGGILTHEQDRSVPKSWCKRLCFYSLFCQGWVMRQKL